MIWPDLENATYSCTAANLKCQPIDGRRPHHYNIAGFSSRYTVCGTLVEAVARAELTADERGGGGRFGSKTGPWKTTPLCISSSSLFSVRTTLSDFWVALLARVLGSGQCLCDTRAIIPSWVLMDMLCTTDRGYRGITPLSNRHAPTDQWNATDTV
jgi:hypothetical protein